jgi:transposase
LAFVNIVYNNQAVFYSFRPENGRLAGAGLVAERSLKAMATLQARTVKGHRYWYIVESRRVNGKPRPIVLAYLGKAEELLQKLQSQASVRVKSYSHGAVAALLALVAELDLVQLINQCLTAHPSWSAQLRDGLTVGASLVLRTLERICAPCSNRAFSEWANTTTLDLLLPIDSTALDSQHFWDQMQAVPVECLQRIEETLVRRLCDRGLITLDTLLFDATNFFTFIDSTNLQCPLAQRGKNKQGRNNLRQVGVLLVVSRQEVLPLFHDTYQGNKADSKLFADSIGRLIERLRQLLGDLEAVTLVFDRGNNSQANLSAETLSLHYVAALVPSQHPDIVDAACSLFEAASAQGKAREGLCYRVRQTLWQRERTMVVYRSQEMYQGQRRGVDQDLDKRLRGLAAMNQSLANPRSKKRQRAEICRMVEKLLHGQFMAGLVQWELYRSGGKYQIRYDTDAQALKQLDQRLGLRMLMTDRHEWSNEAIQDAYHSQAWVEFGFRNLKNPYHLGLRPQYHWTDQKIRVHVFTCVLGLLLVSLLYDRARKAGYGPSSYDTLLEHLNGIRLAAVLRQASEGAATVEYQLEELEPQQLQLIKIFGLQAMHRDRPQIPGVVVYA